MRALLVSLVLVACGSKEISPTYEAGTGGAPVASGGTVTAATGGTVQVSTGGTTVEPVTTATELGGALGTGGSVATGGAAVVLSATGGTMLGTGGAATGGVATGGVATGGVGTGGKAATGGAATGGTATGGNVATGGAGPIGIAGAAGYACPLWVINQGDKGLYDSVTYPYLGMCKAASDKKCSNVACLSITPCGAASADSLQVQTVPCSLIAILTRDLKQKWCEEFAPNAVPLTRWIPGATEIRQDYWLIEMRGTVENGCPNCLNSYID